MKIAGYFAFLLLLFSSCNPQQKDDSYKEEAIHVSVTDRQKTDGQLQDSLANQAREKAWQDELAATFDSAVYYRLSDEIRVDLNGDGQPEQVRYTIAHQKGGIIITDGKTATESIIGLGHDFASMGDDFSWVDYWGVVYDDSTYALLIAEDEVLGDTLIRLSLPALLLRKEESGGGLISFRNDAYGWIHQAD